MLSLFSYVPFCLIALKSVTAQYLPNAQALTIKEIQHLYFDAATHGFFSAITPCTNYQDPTANTPNNALGMQTAAEWIRTAFRRLLPCTTSYEYTYSAALTNYITDDFVTANIYTETGGLDASIGFETTRAENVGPAFNDALLFFSFFYNAQVSSESSEHTQYFHVTDS